MCREGCATELGVVGGRGSRGGWARATPTDRQAPLAAFFLVASLALFGLGLG